jgi:hypothetical protein
MNDTDIVICGGGAKPTDLHLLSTVYIEEEIFKLLKRREGATSVRRKQKQQQQLQTEGAIK